MRVPRVYVERPLAAGATVELAAGAAAHLGRVLRVRVGDPVVLFDGRGGEYRARIERADRRGVQCVVEAFADVDREAPLAVTLGQGISRGERMDYALQKAVELGVAAVAPLVCTRTTVRLDAVRAAQRLRHWQGVIAGACEQSGRCRLPRLHPILTLREWLGRAPSGTGLVLRGDAGTTLAALPPPAGDIVLLVGPEGGLTAEELAAATAAGFTPVRLGPRVLRTETAAVAALAAVQVLWGDLR